MKAGCSRQASISDRSDINSDDVDMKPAPGVTQARARVWPPE